jgi:arginase
MPDSVSDAWDLIVVPWHLDEYIPDFPVPAGTAATINPPLSLPLSPPLPDGAVPGRVTVLHRAVADAATMAVRPLLLSGDCPVGLAVAAALQRRHREFAVIWLDAHGDFNTPAITISGYLGGMAVAMLTGRAPELFADPLGLRPVPDHNIVLADARDLDPAERDALAASQVRHIPATADALRIALSALGGLPVYLHVDVDILDSNEVPGLRFPTGPGPTLADIEDCLRAITASADVVAASLACAWLPGEVSKPHVRTAIARLAAALGTQLTWLAWNSGAKRKNGCRIHTPNFR